MAVGVGVSSVSAQVDANGAPDDSSDDNSSTNNETGDGTGVVGPSNWVDGVGGSGGGSTGVSANESGVSAGASGGGGFGVGSFGIPSGEEWMESAIQWIIDETTSEVAGYVDGFNHIMFTVPAPGEPLDPVSWYTDDSGWWPGTYVMFWISAAISMVLYIPAVAFGVDKPNSNERTATLLRIVKAFAIGTLFGIPVLAMGGHAINAFSLAIAPSGTEFMETPGDVSKLGLGLIFGFALVIAKSGVVFVGLLALLGLWFLMFVCYAFWPLCWAFAVQESSNVRNVGYVGIATYVILLAINFFQTGILRFLYHLPFSVGDINGTLLALAVTIVGLTVALIALPIGGFEKLLPASAAVMGQRAARKAGGFSVGRGAYNRYRAATADTTAGSTPAPRGSGPVRDPPQRTPHSTSPRRTSGGMTAAATPPGSGPMSHSGSRSSQFNRRTDRLTQDSSPTVSPPDRSVR
ncbi:hypothetical protein [Halegenticoccus tardaugens]|uniref:hypothetical protein n=1 Tax=Halegenticoccus tardaugens TaxID=2071624 RepID=UPI00100A785D|nr:hypothetical protein [Halegenticoccus tardaugens]